MINEGRLCIVPGKYRTAYLPTISKLIYKELARRYVNFMQNMKTLVDEPVDDEEVHKCEWCEEDDFDSSDLFKTDLGVLCQHCIDAIRSRGERITIFF